MSSTQSNVPPGTPDPGPVTQSQAGARLAGKVIILTGAAGNIGSFISRTLLREGAKLVMTGRNEKKLLAFIERLAEEGYDRAAMHPAVGDCALPDVCRAIVGETIDHYGELHVLINNAGGAGPKQTLENIPLSEAEGRASGDNETLYEAAMNLLGGPWNMARAAVPHLAKGGSIINVSTIFSRTPYFGRIPYVVPKSGLNAFSVGLARELGDGDRGIRVNSLFPGPIESERIDTVFRAMDRLQDQPEGTTGQQFRDLMIVRRPDGDGNMVYRYPTPQDVADTLCWLSTAESGAFSGHAFEVTNGMQVPAQSRAKLVSWPDNRLVDLHGQVVLVVGGADLDEAMAFVERNRERGASIALAFRTIENVSRARARVQAMNDPDIRLLRLDPLQPESVERAFEFVSDQFGRLDGVIMLPATPNGQHGYSLGTAEDEDVERFVNEELVAPVAFARALARSLHLHMEMDDAPMVCFVTNPDDGHGNRLNEIKRAAVEALIRVWRLEEDFRVRKGELPWSCLVNQIVRYDNCEPDNLAFTADWTATLNNRARKMDPINLWVPKSIGRATGKSAKPLSIQRVLPGLHSGKCAVVTGASLGIGLQLGRYLAMAGARVLLSARGEKRLAEARDSIIAELRAIGYARPEQRVEILAGIDVGSEEALDRLFEHAIQRFGEVDYLINNAGISGAEEMVVDMERDAWDRTMEANLVSNYSLIRKFAPRMKARGSGRILNVSSYFGGEKYLAVAYPNRADYAVSKAGQRVLAEILSRHLGPEIQINAMAPGPVDGARLRGLDGAPGLFERRARLILENKRLNQVHGAMLAVLEDGDLEALQRLAENRIEDLQRWDPAPKPLRRLFAQAQEGRQQSRATHHLLSRPLAEKLMKRLVLGGVLPRAEADAFLERFVEPDEGPFFADEDIKRGAARIEEGIINRLHLHRMPTDEQVALSTVFSLADDIVSGES
ncbi:MAG: SDR family NAD(P)-dependent oxidoreductase, partial [Gammaproteobacteria bacterium]